MINTTADHGEGDTHDWPAKGTDEPSPQSICCAWRARARSAACVFRSSPTFESRADRVTGGRLRFQLPKRAGAIDCGTARAGLSGRQEHCHRVPLGRGQVRPPSRLGGRTDTDESGCDRGRVISLHSGGSESDSHRSYCHGTDWRTSRRRVRGEPCPPGRKYHRSLTHERRSEQQVP